MIARTENARRKERNNRKIKVRTTTRFDPFTKFSIGLGTCGDGDVYLPLKMSQAQDVTYSANLKLKKGVSVQVAEQEVRPLLQQFDIAVRDLALAVAAYSLGVLTKAVAEPANSVDLADPTSEETQRVA